MLIYHSGSRMPSVEDAQAILPDCWRRRRAELLRVGENGIHRVLVSGREVILIGERNGFSNQKSWRLHLLHQGSRQ
jgi:hypothetical protein